MVVVVSGFTSRVGALQFEYVILPSPLSLMFFKPPFIFIVIFVGSVDPS